MKEYSNSGWNMIGELYGYEISRENLYDLFILPSDKVYDALDKTKLVYRADSRDPEIKRFYLVMQQQNGSLLVAEVYDSMGPIRTRWLFALKKLKGNGDESVNELPDNKKDIAGFAGEKLSVRQEIMLPDFIYDGNDPLDKLVYATETEKYSRPQEGFTVVAPKIHGSYEEDGYLKVFVTTYFATYKLYDNVLDIMTAGVVPSAITFKKDGSGSYIPEKHEQSGDGADWEPSIRKFCTMPVSGKEIPGLADEIIHHYGNHDDIRNLHYENLSRHLKAKGIYNAVLYNSRGEVEFIMSGKKTE